MPTTLIFRSLIFTLLIGAGANVEVPLGPVPFILSDFFVLLAGLLMTARWAALSVALYLGFGILGLPIFAGGASGWAYFNGPTGGYLIGFLLGAVVASLIAHGARPKRFRDVIATLSGQATIFALGVPWLRYSADLSWELAIENGFTTFLVPIAIKLVAVVLAAFFLRRFRMFQPGWPANTV